MNDVHVDFESRPRFSIPGKAGGARTHAALAPGGFLPQPPRRTRTYKNYGKITTIYWIATIYRDLIPVVNYCRA